jgi:hypothetical protein
MKKHNLSLMSFLLVALLLGACSVNKTRNLDLFGGGISGSKPVHNSTQTVAEKLPDLVSEESLQTEGVFLANKLHLSEKNQHKINYVLQDWPVLKVAGNKIKSVHDIKNKIIHKQNEKERPEISKRAKKVFLLAASMLSLGWIFQILGSYALFNVGAILTGLGYILLTIAFIMALTGWLNTLIKNKSGKKITFWHVLGGLFLLFLMTLVVVLSLSEGGGWYK